MLILFYQSRIQSPQALWAVVSRQERLWGTGILLPQDFCVKTMQAFTGQPIKKFKQNSNSLESLLATNHWPKSLRTLGTRLTIYMF